MNDLERVRQWIKEGFRNIPDTFTIDFTNKVPNSMGLFPGGLVEIERRETVLGEVIVTNQYNFALYCLLPFSQEAEEQAAKNAGWVIDLQKWVQQQSVRCQAPTFGNYETEREVFKAQNGALYQPEKEGTALYVVLLSAEHKNFYEE